MAITKQKQTHRYREQNLWLPVGGGREEGQNMGRGLRVRNYYT